MIALAVQERIESESGEARLLVELSGVLEVEDTLERVFRAAFDWYFIPRSEERRAYAERVVQAALVKYEHRGELPDWLVRVHELRICSEPSDGVGVPPPYDPKYWPSS